MKKVKKVVLMFVLASFLLASLFSCYGNFSLTRKLYEWNGSLGDKYINNLIFWILLWIPVYSVATSIDFLVLNTIEFWTGSNPMAMSPGEEVIKYAQTEDAEYKITITKNNIIIDEIAGANSGQQVHLLFNPDNSSWYMVNDGQDVKIATVNGNTMDLIYPSGNTLSVQITQ
ncbi:MAG: DUF3332 domain-containing protein [Candidatus Syntrophosphaera sp.]|nr:DUF3332 domain-containing protein [Candidatus Syntrophosphaera sp.]